MTDLPNGAGDRFQEGVNLSNLGETQAATKALLECVNSDPGNSAYVEAYLSHLALDHSSVPSLDNDDEESSLEPPPELFHALLQRDFATVLKLGPNFLAANPNHVPTLRGLAAACAECGHYEAELCYLKSARECDPKNGTVLRQQCDTLERLRRYEEAIQGWYLIESENPEDPEAADRIVRLTIARGRQPFGLLDDLEQLDAIDSARRTRRPATEGIQPRIGFISSDFNLDSLEDESPAGHVKLTPMQRLQKLVREFPSNADLHLQLAMLYLEKGRDYDAEQVLLKARDATDEDRRVVELFEDVSMLRFAKKIELARERLALDSKPELQRELDELIERRDRFELQVFQHRSQRDPHNMQLRFQLACRWKQSGRRREALQAFEEVLHDPPHRSAAAVELAGCMLESHDFARAFRYYRLAIESANLPEQLEVKKRALLGLAELGLRFRMSGMARDYLDGLLRIEPSHEGAKALLAQVD